MIFLTSSILLGFVRLCLIVLFLFYLNRKFVNITRRVNLLDFIISNWFSYTSILIVIIFALVELNGYNLFNCFFIMTIIIFIDIIGFENLKNPRQYFNKHLKSSLLSFLRNIEIKKSFWYWVSFNYTKKTKSSNNTFLLILTLFIGCVTFLSRYYFIIYDNYSLTDAWIYDLNKVIQFDNQYWFTYELATDAELAIVNFYGKITDVSPAIAMQVISILESTLLAIIIFWTIHKLTPSKFIAPVIASLSFALIYVLTPINVYFILKGNPIFLALTMILPSFVYFLKPDLLKIKKIHYFFTFLLALIAIGLIDLFTFCILIPPFFIIGICITKRKNKIYNLLVLLAFIVALGILFLIYNTACYYQGADLVEFIHQNLLSVSSYTYVPQLIFPYEVIIQYVQYSTFISFFIILLLMLIKKENWRSTIIFFIYFNILILFTYIQNEWIDIDMLNNAISVLLPIILGLNIAILVRIANFGLYKLERFTPITVTIIIALMLSSSVYYQEKVIKSLTVSDQTPKQILDAYDKIQQTFFDRTYCVVNDPATQVISTNSHFFMNYDFFLNDYSKIDSINTKNRKDPKFLVKNPQYSLSKSVLVFVLNDKNKDENNTFAINKKLKPALIKELKLLRKRGREVKLFYDSEFLKVYEVVNNPRESKVSNLIFEI